jgi:signal transduction histidine kinase
VRKLPSADLAVGAASIVLVVLATMGTTALQGGRFGSLDAGEFVLLAVAAGATGALRRVAPAWGLAVTMAAVCLYLYIGGPYGPVQLCMVVAMFELARRRPLRTSLPACLVAAAVATATILPRLLDTTRTPVVLAVAWTAWVVLPWSLGALVNALRLARRDLVARVALEERMAIAAEVHDVAGHGFAVTAMQAGVALLVFDESPEQARRCLEAIHATSTASLTDLRGRLSTFHPEPGHDELTALVEQVRAGGVPVDLEVAAPVSPVAYRVVRESLTNVVRHAGPARAAVRITERDGELLVRIADDGRIGTATGAPGRGLTGMRRRVEAAGGRFAAGPGADGGFLVTAALPLGGTR